MNTRKGGRGGEEKVKKGGREGEEGRKEYYAHTYIHTYIHTYTCMHINGYKSVIRLIFNTFII